MDLSSIKPTERTVEIKHPGTGNPLGIRVNVVSIEDERLKPLRRMFADEALKREQKGKSAKSADIEANANQLLFRATTGWEWYEPEGGEMPTFHDEVPEFNQKNFMAIVKELPWFGTQISEELDDTKAFFGNSKSN